MISVKSVGSFDESLAFLKLMESNKIFNVMDKYGRIGVDQLSRATPRETGETSQSWSYTVTHLKGKHALNFFNDHTEDGVNIAIILQYGHGTGTGGYVQGIDYINPVIRPLFQKLLDDIWRQVING